ncbi:MAG: hypothetical protein F7C82_04245 [Desulfurococcales archaeon]|nr:hypothetical protein [Desulfurococcales archaeon]
MMQTSRICPRCGRSESEVEFIGPFCRDCYIQVYGVATLPKQVDFVYCQYCGRYKYQGGWNEPTGTIEETLIDYLTFYLTRKLRPTEHLDEAWISEIRLDKEFVGPAIYNAFVKINGRRGDVEVIEEKIVTVKVNAAVCPVCTRRITKRGYNAILQIRSSEGKLSENLRERVNVFLSENLSGRLAESIIGFEEHKEGFDILIEDPSIARMIAAKLKSNFMAKTIETFKLVGRNPDGTRKGRLTISVRIPEISPGEIIMIDGKPYLFLAVSRGNNLLLVDLETGREEHMSIDVLWQKGFQPYPGGVDLKRYMLISRDKNTTMFLDAESGYRNVIEVPTSTVKVYVDRFIEGREYKVFLASNMIYVVEEIIEEGK